MEDPLFISGKGSDIDENDFDSDSQELDEATHNKIISEISKLSGTKKR